MNILKLNKAGFTLLEVLMAVMLVAIITMVALTQFTDFTRETKNASVKQSLVVLRNGIMKQYAQRKLRCQYTGIVYPALAALEANDITDASDAATCSTTEIASPADRKFVAADDMPENPWSDKTCTAAQRRDIVACNVATCPVGAASRVVANNCAGAAWAGTECGWCYNVANGQIWANSRENGGVAADETTEDFF